MLLINHGEAKIAKFDPLLKERMGADENIRLPRRQRRQFRIARAALVPPGQESDANTGSFGKRRKPGEMLLRENAGRGHQRALPACLHRRQQGQHSDQGFPGTDIALKQTQHALR